MATRAEIEALAVAKEIAANKRAQAAGWPDAASYERDANRRRQLGLPPLSYGAGTLNNAAPSFQGPAYYNQMFNRPIQDWSQFMPTNSPLAGGGGALYQTPWGYGTGGGSGWGGAFGGGGGFMGGGLMGGGYPGGYPGWGGGYPGYTQPGFGGYRPPQFGGGTTPGFSPGPIGSYPQPTTPGRHHPEMYDADGNYVGAEGGGAREANWEGGGAGGGGAGGVPWQDIPGLAKLGTRLGWDHAQDPSAGWANNTIDTTIEYDAFGDPVTRTTPTGLLSQDFQTPTQAIGYQDDFSTNPFAPGLLAVDDFSTMTPQVSQDFQTPTQSIGYVDDFSSSTPTAPVNVDTFAPVPQATKTARLKASTAQAAQAAKTAQMKASTAAAQQRYLNALNDEDARRMNQMSQAQIANEMAAQAAVRAGQGLLAADIEGDDQGYSESGMGQQGGRGHPGMR